MESSKKEGGAVRKRESKLKPPKNYYSKSHSSSLPQLKKSLPPLQTNVFGFKSKLLSDEDSSTGSEDPYDTPDIVSSCDSKVSIIARNKTYLPAHFFRETPLSLMTVLEF